MKRNMIKNLAKRVIAFEDIPNILRFWSAMNKLIYFGHNFQCPFCNSRLRRLIPYGINFPVLVEKHVVGAGYRPNGLCPVCRTIDRERLLWLFLKHQTGILSEPTKLLHVAPERSLNSIFDKLPHIDRLTVDISGKGVVVNMDITDIQYSDKTFDAVISCHVLQDVVDDKKAISEFYRVLKPGGWAILQVPLSLTLQKTLENFSLTPPEQLHAFGDSKHVRIYATEDYKQRIEQAGFIVEIFDWTTEMENFGGHVNRFALIEDEKIYRAIKPK
jgi:predicted SAM-dependent methyltransferase